MLRWFVRISLLLVALGVVFGPQYVVTSDENRDRFTWIGAHPLLAGLILSVALVIVAATPARVLRMPPWMRAASALVLVAALIPWVDAASVYRGPTKVVVEEQPGLFERIAIAFAVPGDAAAAFLGPPDVIFFALFLAAAARYGLRVRATWLGMAGALSATLLLTDALDLNGLPALPAISLGFLLPNADLVWRSLRREGRGTRRAPP